MLGERYRVRAGTKVGLAKASSGPPEEAYGWKPHRMHKTVTATLYAQELGSFTILRYGEYLIRAHRRYIKLLPPESNLR